MDFLADAEERLEAALQRSREELRRLEPLTSRPIHADLEQVEQESKLWPELDWYEGE